MVVIDEVPNSDRLREEMRGLLAGYGVEDVQFVSVVSCQPPEGKKPTKGEVEHCRVWVKRQLDEIKPKAVLIVGNLALLSITGSQGITSKRGRPFKEDGRVFLPTIHPGLTLRDPDQRVLLETDLELFADIVSFGDIPQEKSLNIVIVDGESLLEEMFEELSQVMEASFDIETNGLNPFAKDAKITAIGFGTERTQWIVPISHDDSPWSFDGCIEIVDRLTDIVSDIRLIAHNGKFDFLWMRVIFGVDWSESFSFDTMLAHYLINENMRHGLKYIAQVYCGAPDWEIDLDKKKGNTSIDQLARYHAHDLYYTLKLKQHLGKELNRDRDIRRVFRRIMMPCARLFIEVEFDGVFIDMSKFHDAENILRKKYDEALEELSQWEPTDMVDGKGRPVRFNWGSPIQLAHLLYDRLGLPVIERTKTGNPSCNESVINRTDHPCVDALLRFRAAKQQLSFFIDGWKPYLHRRPNGYYLHPSFKLHGTVTGRLSCEHPNLQQVPRDPAIRSLITAPDGWTLLECDLSQIELRIAAELAQEQSMLQAFMTGIDVHWLTAMREIARGGALVDLVKSTARKIGGKSLNYSEAIELLLRAGHEAAIAVSKEWKEYRKKAKAINFGYLYGMWWKKFKDYARDNYGVTVSDEEAQQSRISFFENYPGFAPWHDRQRRFARTHGYVRSLSGRKRRLPAALSREDTPERREAERQAINSPVQSFANELNLMSAIQLRREYSRKVVKICGTVHDAILLMVRNDYVEEVFNRLLEIMSWPQLMDDFDITLTVPIVAEGSIGAWGNGVSLERWKSDVQG